MQDRQVWRDRVRACKERKRGEEKAKGEANGKGGQHVQCFHDRNTAKKSSVVNAFNSTCVSLSAAAHYNMGVCYFQLGDYQSSINSFQESLKLSPHHADAHTNIATAHIKLNKNMTEALNHLRAAANITPQDAEIQVIGTTESLHCRPRAQVSECMEQLNDMCGIFVFRRSSTWL
jgi:tetratricopeptide (TPR) repeat protein